jgi:arginine/lysine/ornithine decarboxylase
VSSIRCKLCSKVEGRKNLLIPKLDSLLKHLGRRKATFVILGVKVGEFYKNKKCAHSKNHVLFTQILTDFVLQLVINQGLAFNKRKYV